MAKTTVNIKGNDWTVKLLTTKQFAKEAAKDDVFGADAYTTRDGSRKIVFQKGVMTPGTIRHELLHAIIYEAPIKSADLTPDQVEEMCAEILDQDFMMYLNLVEEILAAFC